MSSSQDHSVEEPKEGLEKMDVEEQQAEVTGYEHSGHSVVMELVFDRLITSLSTDVAFQMHRMLKTGVYPLSDLMNPEDRTELYPSIYKNNSDDPNPNTELKKYAIFHPEPRKRRRLEDAPAEKPYFSVSPKQDEKSMGTGDISGAAEDKEKSSASSAVATGGGKQPPVASTAALQPQATHLDIWGKAPPKEPKDMVPCTLCGRQVNTLRYAPHLDKCMGIGTTVRQAALNASGFVPSAISRGAPK